VTQIERAESAPIVIRPGGLAVADYTDADFTVSDETVRRILDAPAENTKRAYDRNGHRATVRRE
jgi:hypothetical protein